MMWRFERCIVEDITDGDTWKGTIDMGLDTQRRSIRIRFLAANAPELKTPEGDAAKAWVRTIMPIGTIVTVDSARWDKYANRIDGRTTLPDGRVLEEIALLEGHAIPY